MWKIKREKNYSDSGRDSNPWPGKLPAMLHLANWGIYRAIQQFSGQVQVLAELPGIQPRRKSSWYIWCGRGAASAKCEVQVQLLNILQTWQSSHNLVRVFQEERKVRNRPFSTRLQLYFLPFFFLGRGGRATTVLHIVSPFCITASYIVQLPYKCLYV